QDEIRKKLHNQVQELKGNIRVYCRVRPLVKTDKHFGKQNISFEFPEDSLNQKIVALTKKQNNLKSKKLKIVKREISFDRVFSPNDKQNVVFEEISQLVQSALDGYKVCIFAYGQTGSGKTFTMEGPENMNNKNDEGMIPRSVKKIFEHIREHKKNWEYKCEVSFLEIYNEEIRDLLTSENKNIQISLEDEYKPAKNAKYVKVTSESEIEPLLRTAKKNRSVGKTDVNEYSSRSHSIFQIILNGKNPETGFSVNGALVLVDLAGSERLKKSNSTGQRKEEAKFINSSLS
ncbi:Kinesin-like protein kifc1, partial [Bonamia ostreae]